MRKFFSFIPGLIPVFFLTFLLPACKSPEKKIADKLSSSLIPVPVKQSPGKGYVVLPSLLHISPDTSSEMVRLGHYLVETMREKYHLQLRLQENKTDSGKTLIRLMKISGSESGKEGYNLTINEQGVSIVAGTGNGIFYGIQTFLQLIPVPEMKKRNPEIVWLKKMVIEDYPRFPWRGMHLDVSRHFFPKEFVKKYIDILALHKMNVFHWHLTDDQGWRIEIKKYPKLTELGAWREDTRDRPWDYGQHPVVPGKPVYGGFYTQDDIREIVQYAGERYVTVVPEIEMPGHSWAALYAYPNLSCSGKPFYVAPNVPFEFTDPYCAGSEQTFRFLEDVLSEVAELFPSPYIHIGGDECKKTPWEKCPKCRLRMQTENLKSVEELQSYFIRRIEKILVVRGKKLIGWDEILEGGLAPEATVMSWRGEDGGIQAARQGHDAVMTPAEVLYLSRQQDEESRLVNEDGFYALREVYSYDPVPSVLTQEEAKHILGAQGCLWTEETQTPEEAECKILPRLCALSEITWSPRENKNYQQFLKRLFYHYNRLDLMHLDYYVPVAGGFRNTAFLGSSTIVSFKVPTGGYTVRYTINGNDPDTTSEKYVHPFQLHANDTLRVAVFLPSGKHSRVRTAIFRSLQLKPPAEIKSPQPGILVTAFTGDISSLDSFVRMKQISSFTMDSIAIPGTLPRDTFGLVFDGFIKVPADGLYTFFIASDDGSRLWVADSLLIDADGIHGPSEESGTIALQKGFHSFRLRYFDRFYGEALMLMMQGPEAGKQRLPKEMLWH